LGELDIDGRLRIVGRKKDMFIVGGFNAYPAEQPGRAVVGVVSARFRHGQSGPVHPMTSRTDRPVAGYRFKSTVQLMVPRIVHFFLPSMRGSAFFPAFPSSNRTDTCEAKKARFTEKPGRSG
ncbi:hypothetical protein ACWDPG_35560, partial [Nocardia sp. NPDC003648]